MRRGLIVIFCLVFFVNQANTQTRWTQNTNHNIWVGNSAACTTSGPGTIHNNSFIRVFDTQDFIVDDTAFFVFVEIGVESTSGGAYDLTARVHHLQGDLLFSNMTLIASTTYAIYPDSSLYKLFIPIDSGYALPGDTLVTEIFAAINSAITFFPGSNPYLETGPSYIAAVGCGLNEPNTYESIGFTQVKLILNLWVNHKPKMQNFAISAFKNNAFQFTDADFESSLIDADNDTINVFQITSIPTFGVLEKNGTQLMVGDTVWSNEMSLLVYIPNTDYVGSDNFKLLVKDNFHWANDTTTVSITVHDWQLNLNENSIDQYLIFPNPTTGLFEIKTDKSYSSLTLYTNDGRKIGVYTESDKMFDLSDYPAGIYFLQIISEESNSVQKLIKY